jgi:hypothetical protein
MLSYKTYRHKEHKNLNCYNQDKALIPAIQHCKKNNHELVFGMAIKWIDDPGYEKDMPEHVAYCKTCHKDIAKGKNKGSVLRSAMEHCEKTNHELAYGIVVKVD